MLLAKLQSDRYLIPIAFVCIYFIWGSTYLATDWAFEAFPPFYMTGIRLLLAGFFLLLFSYKEFKKTSWTQLQNSAIFGLLILAIGSGGSMWSVLYLDTGIASLLIGAEPLVLVLLLWLLKGSKPSWQKTIGVVIGIVGMFVLLNQQHFSLETDAWKGILAISIAIVGWTIGSIYIKDANVPKSKLLNTAVQMITAGLILLGVAVLVQEDISTVQSTFSWTAFLSFVYLLFFGSVIAYTAFNYLLMKQDPRKVATVTYVNPIIALILGWYFNNELISIQSLVAAAILILGVVFIIAEKENKPAANKLINNGTAPCLDNKVSHESKVKQPL